MLFRYTLNFDMKTKILIVEDNHDFRNMVKCFLEKQGFGFEVLEAPTGLLGVEKALEQRPNIILMDIRLPSLNGIEASSQIKKIFPECKIIILTMFESPREREVFKNDNIDDFLGKSEVYEKLIPTIQKYLKESFDATQDS